MDNNITYTDVGVMDWTFNSEDLNNYSPHWL